MMAQHHNNFPSFSFSTCTTSTILNGLFLCALLFAAAICLPNGVWAELTYTHETIKVPLDRSADTPTIFSLRYDYSDLFVTNPTNCLVLTGVCGQYNLDDCKKKLKVLEEMAPRLNARILLVEHRFYGESLPEKAFDNLDVLDNLRVEEVLDDVREAVTKSTGATTEEEALKRAIVVGEDYGGALVLWLNMDNKKAKADEQKGKPLFVWAASPTPLALWSEAPFSTKFDQQLTDMLTKEFGCQRDALASVFKWMDEMVAKEGIAAVKSAFHYSDGDTGIDGVKGDVLEWLRQFTLWKKQPGYDETEGTKQFVWPLEEFCTGLNAKANGEERAKFYGEFVLKMAETQRSTVKYKELLYGNFPNQRLARDFQRCTQLVRDNCAAGGANDPFFEQCKAENYMETKCKDELLNVFKDKYNPTMLKRTFIADTFGFDFETLDNVLITGAQFDQFFSTVITNAIENQARNNNRRGGGKSNSNRHFYMFPSIGLTQRAQEVLLPSSCDSLALKQTRTQVLDLLSCIVDSTTCPVKEEWPVALVEETRPQDALKHQAQCKDQRWAYPWAEYGKKEPEPKPDPEPEPTADPTDSSTTTTEPNGATPTVATAGFTGGLALALMPLTTMALII